MEEVREYEGITHQICIQGDLKTNVPFSAFVAYIFQTFTLVKGNCDTSKDILTSFMRNKNYVQQDPLNQFLNSLKTMDLNRLIEHIHYLSNYKDIFRDTKIISMGTSPNKMLHLISKELHIMFIIKKLGSPDKHICASISNKLIKITLLEGYIPGFDLSVNDPKSVFFNYPKTSREQNKMILSVFKKNLEVIMPFISGNNKNVIVDRIKRLNLDGDLRIELDIMLERAGGCHGHSLCFFPCGVKHCKTCALNNKVGNMIKCSCGMEFDSTLVNNLTTLATLKTMNTMKQVSNMMIAKNQTVLPSNATISTGGSSIKEQVSMNKIEIKNQVPNPTVGLEVANKPQAVNCWGCGKENENVCAQCPDHPTCQDCTVLAQQTRYACLVCNICTLHIFAPAAIQFGDWNLHPNCLDAYLQNSPIQIQCWSCELEYTSNVSYRCEKFHFFCEYCYQQINEYCSPCNNLTCGICSGYIPSLNACTIGETYCHRECMQRTINPGNY